MKSVEQDLKRYDAKKCASLVQNTRTISYGGDPRVMVLARKNTSKPKLAKLVAQAEAEEAKLRLKAKAQNMRAALFFACQAGLPYFDELATAAKTQDVSHEEELINRATSAK